MSPPYIIQCGFDHCWLSQLALQQNSYMAEMIASYSICVYIYIYIDIVLWVYLWCGELGTWQVDQDITRLAGTINVRKVFIHSTQCTNFKKDCSV